MLFGFKLDGLTGIEDSGLLARSDGYQGWALLFKIEGFGAVRS